MKTWRIAKESTSIRENTLGRRRDWTAVGNPSYIFSKTRDKSSNKDTVTSIEGIQNSQFTSTRTRTVVLLGEQPLFPPVYFRQPRCHHRSKNLLNSKMVYF